ncbi:MAG TPA: glutamine--fructose-6-phosphate transaminase (isomerizing) [Chloroflexota bacterium]|nr:glutamine--fructose-6-phosphate transaminase (isomerizing) [Chloroflexota bacterium]
MCGIVGYVGYRDATRIVYDGLKRLEYRGYDSSGIALLSNGQVELRRSVGKLDALERIIALEPLTGTIGIGHTRWATHGRPSEENAHPHLDCRREIVVIHNGIVENYLELRQRLRDEGHHFRSETDTEVIVHLVESYCTKGMDLVDATRHALAELRGNHAVVVMSAREPDRLVAARLGNAGGVTLGVGNGEMYVASDLPAILDHTRTMAFLDNQELALITRGGFQCFRLDGTSIDKPTVTVNWDPVSAAKGGYKHFMLKEIHEQPRAVADAIRDRVSLAPPSIHLDGIPWDDRQWLRFRRVVVVGCGTAWHAGLVAKFMLEDLARVPVEVDYADEYRYRRPIVDAETLFIAVTQSGETVDVLVSMAEARANGATVLGVVNAIGSQAARSADGVIYTHAGPEIGVASTKAFTTQLAALYLLALKLGQVRGTISESELVDGIQHLLELPHRMGDVLQRDLGYADIANRYFKCRDFLFLGRGINYPIALEGALKLKEISYIHAEGYPAGEMKHGPIALIDEDMPVVAIAVHDHVYEKTLNNVAQVKARGGILIGLGNDGDENFASTADHSLWVPPTNSHLTPLLTVLPLQLLAYYLADRRGCDIDQPRNLAKSVTVE